MSRTALKIDWVKVTLEKMDTQMDTAPPPYVWVRKKYTPACVRRTQAPCFPPPAPDDRSTKGFLGTNKINQVLY